MFCESILFIFRQDKLTYLEIPKRILSNGRSSFPRLGSALLTSFLAHSISVWGFGPSLEHSHMAMCTAIEG